jgi:hypothetical protein
MSWVAAAIGGGALIGAGASYLGSKDQSKAAKDAAKSQQKGSDKATEAQLEMYYQSREDLAPWREAGGRSLKDLERVQGTYEGAIMDPNQYMESPAYNWLQEQGIKAMDRGASAAGTRGSGGHSKDLIQYGQGLAKTDYGGYLSRLESLMNRYAGTSQVGQTSTATTAALGANAANQVGQNALYSGQANAASQINQGNSRTGLYNNLSNIGSNAVNQGITYNYLQNMGNQQPSIGAQGAARTGYQYTASGQSAGFK